MRAIHLALIFSFLNVSVWAADISVRLEVDSTEIGLNDEITLSVTVNGLRRAGQPEVKNIEAFDIGATSSSSRVNIVNGRMDVEAVTQWTLYPKKPGAFSLGPATIQHNGKSYVSNVIELKVVEGTRAQNESARHVYIKTFADKKSAYVNEQVTHTFQLHTRVDLANANLESPDMSGFWKEALGKQREFTKVENGERWQITEIKSALFPIGSGEVEIPSSTLVAEAYLPEARKRSRLNDFFFNGFSRTKRLRLVSEPTRIEVKALPKNAPASFSGAVGSFRAEARVSERATKVGESLTLTVQVIGKGNIRDFRLTLPEVDDSKFKVYADEPSLELNTRDEVVQGTKTFKWAIVPLSAGQLELPKISLTYFDPVAASYVSREISVPPITVEGGSGELEKFVSSDRRAKKQKVEVSGTDLIGLSRGLGALSSDLPSSSEKMALLLVLILSPLFSILVSQFRKRKERLSGNPASRLRRVAMKHALAEIEKQKKDWSNAIVAKSLRGYLSGRFTLDGGALTSAEVAPKLSGKLPQSTLSDIESLLQKIEQAQYAGGSEKELLMTYSDFKKFLSRLEKESR